MVVNQARGKTKSTGKKYKKSFPKRQYESGSQPTLTKVGETKRKSIRVIGGNDKQRLLSADKVNLFDPKAKKYVQAKIVTSIENAANRHFVRRNILTKGALIETDKGKARITSRPGQEGAISAVLE